MSKREVPKLNRDNFTTWKILMKLHLGGLGDHAQSTITIEHFDPVGAPIAKDMRKKKEHNQAMLEIASTLIYAKFDDIKNLDNANKMWDALQTIYVGENNVLKAKFESLRGKFDKKRIEKG